MSVARVAQGLHDLLLGAALGELGQQTVHFIVIGPALLRRVETFITDQIVARYVQPVLEENIDTLILGCTHYPLVRPIIQRMLGPETTIVTSGAPLARQVEHVLGTRGLDSPAAGAQGW